jgi:hypothetical protein
MLTPPPGIRDIGRSPEEGGDGARLVEVGGRTDPAAEPAGAASDQIERWRDDIDRDDAPEPTVVGLVPGGPSSRG